MLYKVDGSELRAVDIHTGNVVASTQTEAGPDGRAIVSFVGGEHPVLVSTNLEGVSTAFSPRTLQSLWRTTWPPDTFPSPDSRYLVINNATNDYQRIDASTGRQLWTHHPSDDYLNGVSFVTAPGVIYLYGVTTDATVHVEALDAETGDVRWTSVLPAENSASVLISDDVTYLYRQLDRPGTSWELTALDVTTGEELWSRPTPRVENASEPLPVDRGLAVPVSDGLELLR